MSCFSKLIDEFPVADFISLYYPFTTEELLFLAQNNEGDFETIFSNEQINWNCNILHRLGKAVIWDLISNNKNVRWHEVIPRFENQIDWKIACWNNSFPWRGEYFERHADELDWEWLSALKVPVNGDVLYRHRDNWDWVRLSMNSHINWTVELLDLFAQRIDWGLMSMNENIDFTPEILEKFRDRWDFSLMYNNHKMVSDPYLPLLQSYAPIEFEYLSESKRDLTVGFIEKNAGLLQWDELSANQYLPWSTHLYQQFESKLNFAELSGNPNIAWTLEFIEKHKKKLNWDGSIHTKYGTLSSLSFNSGLPWSFNLVEKYFDHWEWGKYVPGIEDDCSIVHDGISRIPELTWTVKEIAKYIDYLHPEYIKRNPNFYKAIENEVGRENIFNLYRSL